MEHRIVLGGKRIHETNIPALVSMVDGRDTFWIVVWGDRVDASMLEEGLSTYYALATSKRFRGVRVYRFEKQQ